MKVTLYMVTTPNGMISKPNDILSFINDFEWQGIMKKAYDTGNCVMGRHAYESLLRKGKFPYNCLNVVMTKSKIKAASKSNKWPDKVIFTNKGPKQVIEMLKEKGFEEVLLVGGGRLNASFMKQGLVDEIVLNVAPEMFTKGTRLFEGRDFYSKLKLLEARQVSSDDVQIRYKVEK